MNLLDPRTSFAPHIASIGLAFAVGANWWQALLVGVVSFVLGGVWYIVSVRRRNNAFVQEARQLAAANHARILAGLCEEMLPPEKLKRLRELRAQFPELNDAQLLRRIDREEAASVGEALALINVVLKPHGMSATTEPPTRRARANADDAPSGPR